MTVIKNNAKYSNGNLLSAIRLRAFVGYKIRAERLYVEIVENVKGIRHGIKKIRSYKKFKSRKSQ